MPDELDELRRRVAEAERRESEAVSGWTHVLAERNIAQQQLAAERARADAAERKVRQLERQNAALKARAHEVETEPRAAAHLAMLDRMAERARELTQPPAPMGHDVEQFYRDEPTCDYEGCAASPAFTVRHTLVRGKPEMVSRHYCMAHAIQVIRLAEHADWLEAVPTTVGPQTPAASGPYRVERDGHLAMVMRGEVEVARCLNPDDAERIAAALNAQAGQR